MSNDDQKTKEQKEKESKNEPLTEEDLSKVTGGYPAVAAGCTVCGGPMPCPQHLSVV